MEDIVHSSNSDFVSSLVPTLCYLVLLMVAGLVGNTIVFLVYYKRFKPSATRTYILAMSVCDLLNNVLALPSDIVEIRFHYSYLNKGSCKFFAFITRLFGVFGALVLVAVALDRWRKICRPMTRQRLLRHIYVELTCLCVFALCASAPLGVLKGLQTIDIKDSANLTGTTCSTDDDYTETPFFNIYNTITGAGFIICVVIMCVAYGLIGRHLWLHKKRNMLFMSRSYRTCGDRWSEHEVDETAQQDQLECERSVEESGHLPEDQCENTSTVTVPEVISDECVQNPGHTPADHLRASSSHTPTSCPDDGASRNNPSVVLTAQTAVLPPRLNHIPHTGTCEPEEPQDVSKDAGDSKQTGLNADIRGSVSEAAEDISDSRSVGTISVDPSVSQTSNQPKGLKVQYKPKKRTMKAKKASGSHKAAPKQVLQRTALMMFVLTVCFIISYLPYLVVHAVHRGRDVETVDLWVRNLHQIALRSSFINSAINPLVYSLCSVKFRQESHRLLCRK